jgi:AcrR family transcriptional regulator
MTTRRAKSSKFARAALPPPRVPPDRPGPAGGKRDRNRQRRVGDLGAAALRLFLQRGIAEVTVDEIVDAAGVAKGSFYRYFRDREELAATLLSPLADKVRAALAACEADVAAARGADAALPYVTLARALAGAATEHPELLRLFLQESRGPAVGARRPVRELADEVTERAIAIGQAARRQKVFRDLDPRVVPLIMIGAGERLLFEHLTRPGASDPALAWSTLVSVVVDGLRPR